MAGSMFGENSQTKELAEELLDSFNLDELLEMNDLSEVEVICLLLEWGYLGEPQRLIQLYERQEDYE